VLLSSDRLESFTVSLNASQPIEVVKLDGGAGRAVVLVESATGDLCLLVTTVARSRCGLATSVTKVTSGIVFYRHISAIHWVIAWERQLPDQPAKPVSGTLTAQAGLLNVPVAAIALITVIHKVFKVGLQPVFADIVEKWRNLTAPLSDLLAYLASFVHLTLPDWYQDAFVLSFILAAVFWRTALAGAPQIADSEWADAVARFLAVAIMSFATSLPLLGFLCPLLIWGGWAEKDKADARYYMGQLVGMGGIVLVFYVANAKL